MLKKLLETKIYWKENSNSSEEYSYLHEGVIYKLKMNNFPDEVMFTLSSINESIDFDDLPKKWKLEGM